MLNGVGPYRNGDRGRFRAGIRKSEVYRLLLLFPGQHQDSIFSNSFLDSDRPPVPGPEGPPGPPGPVGQSTLRF